MRARSWREIAMSAVSGGGRFFSAILVVPLVLLAACGTVHVETAADPAADFHKFHTFQFKAPRRQFQSGELSGVNQQRVRDGIRKELERRGLSLADQPDLFVSFYLRVQAKTFDLENPTAGGDSVSGTMADYFGFAYRSGQSLNQQGSIRYQEGSLVVDMVEPGTTNLAWRGIATGVLYTNRTDEQVERRIQEAVHSIFGRFPR
jgi:hypothetical protein